MKVVIKKNGKMWNNDMKEQLTNNTKMWIKNEIKAIRN